MEISYFKFQLHHGKVWSGSGDPDGWVGWIVGFDQLKLDLEI